MHAENAIQSPLQFRVFTDLQIEQIYQATLECLQRTGVDVLDSYARDLLADAGAEIDGVRARIPAHIIQDAIAANPRTFSIWGRDPRHQMRIVPGRVHFGPGPSCTYYMDPETGERRRSQRQDPGFTARVADALENIDYVMGLALPDDIHPDLAPVYEFAAMVANTGKPMMTWAYTLDNIKDIYEMAVAASGGEEAFRRRPLAGFFVCSQPPLVHTGPELTNTFWAADHGFPIIYQGGGTTGVTAPITGAGNLVISFAAVLSGLAIIQLHRRGTPVCIGSVPTALDPRSGRPAYGSPETSLFSAAMAEVSAHLGLAFMGTAGASEAKMVDTQAAVESTVQVVFSLLSGACLPHDIGMLDCADIGSLEMLVLTDEIIGMVRRVTRGIEVNDLTLMLDLIDEVGPGGEFMTAKETSKMLRQEIWVSKLMDRQPWEVWESAGQPNLSESARNRVRTILAEHQPLALPDGAAERIEQILQQAEERVARS